MKSVRSRRQRGVALLAMLAVIMLAAAWMLVSQLNAGSGGVEAARKLHNAEILQRAKLALIGYVAAQASKSFEPRPGALPCPEAAGYFDSTTQDGQAASSCALPKVGRFPWRTIGTDKMVDASGEPLWYVVSPGWAYTSGTGPVINSNTVGQLTVDGVVNDAVALIIAPGPAFKAAASTSPVCAAKTQTRPTTGSPDWSNYLECENATYPTADSVFVTTGPSASFNDQVIKLTVADIMPAIEAGIASRIEREIALFFTGIYSGQAAWGTAGIPPTIPDKVLLPMAVAFSIPGTNANAYAGAPATQGLLPLSYAETTAGSGTACTPTAAPNYCEPNFVKWTATPAATATLSGSAIVHRSSSCSITTATTTTLDCTAYGYYLDGWPVPTASVSIQATANNVGAALRTFNTNVAIRPIGSTTLTAINPGYTATGAMDSSGAAVVTVSGTSPSSNGALVGIASCGFSAFLESFLDCYKYTFSVPIFLLADHANIHTLLDSTNDTGWFVRNEWHNLAYYAVASAVAPGGLGSCSSVTPITCLQVTYHPSNGKQRAVLLLAGRAITGQNRTSSALSNWFEGANAGGASPFEARSATLLTNKTFNDRIAVLSTN